MIQGHPIVNGIDYLEVVDGPDMPDEERQRTLRVRFLNPVTVPLGPANVRIEGGDRVRDVRVVEVAATADPLVLSVAVDRPGDFSIYTLRLAGGPATDLPPDGYDPILSRAEFSFKVACPDEFDCREPSPRRGEPRPRPAIDYLARDYAGFRRLLLDRLALLMPEWNDRNPADGAVAVVELLAYVADYLSYRQDVAATEGYLGTARLRRSVRRHARLVDYPMHDGCNARAWVRIRVRDGLEAADLRPGVQLLTRVPSLADGRLQPRSLEYDRAIRSGAEVFEPIFVDESPIRVRAAHDEIRLYAWGNQACCLPAGATRATLRGPLPHLAAGDVLIFGEVRGPLTGSPADADPTRRHAVRLTSATPGSDPLGGYLDDPDAVDPPPVAVVDVTWAPADALPFPLWITSPDHPGAGGGAVARGAGSGVAVPELSVAWGNVVLADHGRTVAGESLGAPPIAPTPPPPPPPPADRAADSRPRFRPSLGHRPLTQAPTVTLTVERRASPLAAPRVVRRVVPFDPRGPAAGALRTDPRSAGPALTVADADGNTWTPRRDLLASGRFDRHLVAEVEAGGVATLRFGDDVNGAAPAARPAARPAAGAPPGWTATYRVGNGAPGNVGAGTIAYVVSDDDALAGATNPLPAAGGLEPETIEEVRLRAPVAFRTQERAVTADDYARIAERHPGVQRAAATLRWTGSWRTVFVTVDRVDGLDVDATFEADMRRHLDRYRMAGVDVEIDGPRFVPLELELSVCPAPGHRAGSVAAALLDALGARDLPDGRRGLFHPDNLSFGQTIYLSRIYATAQAVPGVASVEVTTFQRQGIPSAAVLRAGKLVLNRLEIARLDNDPDHPERGVLRIAVPDGAGGAAPASPAAGAMP